MEIGKRTVISIFEYNARFEPEQVWALRPKNDDDLMAGFESITYGQCMEAVNHTVQWLQKALPESSDPSAFDAFAYQGPSDLRVLLLCLAAAKLHKQILLPSRRASPNAQRHLVKTAKCVAIIFAKGVDPMFDPAEVGAKQLIAPELSDWLFATDAAPPAPPLDTSWAHTQDDPWIIFHTSGTTGLPKIVRYTHKMMAKFDARPPKDESPTPIEHFSHGRWFTPVPLSHFVGLCIGLQYAPVCGATFIAPPAIKGPPVLSARQLIDLIHQTEPNGLVLTPAEIEKIISSAGGWEALKLVNCINFVGAQLRKSVGDKLVENGNTVIYGLGTTEAGGYPQLLRFDKEWDWFTFPEAAGVTFERYPGDDDVYELVFYKQPDLERLQQVFLAFPDLDVLRTKDLYYKHPSLRNTWQIAGRSDDFFKLSSGYGVFAIPVEEQVLEKSSHLISAAVLAGADHEHPCLLVMPKVETHGDKLVDDLWPGIEEANRTSAEMAQIKRELVLVADPARPFTLNIKGSVSRRDTLTEYAKDIDTLYDGMSAWYHSRA